MRTLDKANNLASEYVGEAQLYMILWVVALTLLGFVEFYTDFLAERYGLVR